MSSAGIQATVNFYIGREADLTSELTGIMTDITRACKQSAEFVRASQDAKTAVREQYDPETQKAQYEEAMDKVEDEYYLKLADISAWESELDVKKENLETEIQATSNYKQSFQSALKQNIKTEFTFGGAAS